MLCRERSAVKSGEGRTTISLLHCKMWSCPFCEPRNAAALRYQIKRGHPSKFLTFTCRPPTERTPPEQARWMKRKVRQAFEEWRRRRPGIEVEYIAVIEAHKSGWPHVHVGARAPSLDWRELRAIWEELTGSFQVDIKKVQKQGGFAKYLAKYLTKGERVEDWGKRHWCSRGWLPDQDEDPLADSFRWFNCEIVTGTAEETAGHYHKIGWVTEEHTGSQHFVLVPP